MSAKLSYTTDSLQTLAQMIHSLHQAWGFIPAICPRQRCEDQQSRSHTEDAGDYTGR